MSLPSSSSFILVSSLSPPSIPFCNQPSFNSFLPPHPCVGWESVNCSTNEGNELITPWGMLTTQPPQCPVDIILAFCGSFPSLFVCIPLLRSFLSAPNCLSLSLSPLFWLSLSVYLSKCLFINPQAQRFFHSDSPFFYTSTSYRITWLLGARSSSPHAVNGIESSGRLSCHHHPQPRHEFFLSSLFSAVLVASSWATFTAMVSTSGWSNADLCCRTAHSSLTGAACVGGSTRRSHDALHASLNDLRVREFFFNGNL